MFDPLTAKETAAAALKFINEKLGARPVVAVVYSHSHGDHFGGVRGVVDEKDVKSGKVKIIAPEGFMQHAVAENIYAGNAMTRRMFYQYGLLLPRNPFGHVDQAISKNNSRAVLNKYLGYWDANPATLIPLSPRDSAPLYVDMMGGAARIIAKGKELAAQGKYLHAVEILNKLVFAEPSNQSAKALLADVYEQIGYQKESSSLRNSFLAGAYELRHGMPEGASPKTAGPDMIRAMSTDLWLDFLGVRLDGSKVEGKHFVINLLTPDNGEQFVVELSNSTLTNIKGQQASKPDLTITINRSDLETLMMGAATLDDLLNRGKARLVGNREGLDWIRNSLVWFNMGFEVLPGTSGTSLTAPPRDPLQQPNPALHAITD